MTQEDQELIIAVLLKQSFGLVAMELAGVHYQKSMVTGRACTSALSVGQIKDSGK